MNSHIPNVEFARTVNLHNVEKDQILSRMMKSYGKMIQAELEGDEIACANYQAQTKLAHMDLVIYDQAMHEWYYDQGQTHWPTHLATVTKRMQEKALETMDQVARRDMNF